jgi:hypothetical protein
MRLHRSAAAPLAHFLTCATALVGFVSPAGEAQRPTPLAGALGAGVHDGSAGGQTIVGPFVGTFGWIHVASVVGVRLTLEYAHNLGAGPLVCVTQPGRPCYSGAPRHLTSFGTDVTVGDLLAAQQRPYFSVGAEAVNGRGSAGWRGSATGVPHVAVGWLLTQTIFIEAGTRWRSDWGGTRFHDVTLLAGLRLLGTRTATAYTDTASHSSQQRAGREAGR